MTKHQHGWPELSPHQRPGFDNLYAINEDGDWGTFKARTAEILRRPDPIGTPQDDRLAGAPTTDGQELKAKP